MAPRSQQHGLYAQPSSNSPSTTSLLPPSARDPPAVQAAFAQGPKPHSLRNMASNSGMHASPYNAGIVSQAASVSSKSISDKFSLSPDPSSWGADISPNHAEPDDYLHNPDPRRDRKNDRGGNVFTYRGLTNLGCLLVLVAGIVTLFAGYPMITFFTKHSLSDLGGFNVGGINGSGQVPSMPGNWGLVDLDTPKDAYTMPSWVDGSEMQLIFSDEFNTDGRTFYPGDDPYWEAVDLHYWATNNMEWYDPAAITTRNGALEITLSQMQTHNLNYQGGMMSSWNKFCFTGGMVVTSVTLPGSPTIVGLWPAIWAMGNLGRAGYGASLEGMWPYTYDACDVGTAPNQTLNGLPIAATENGDRSAGGALSYLPGQRLSRCTCPGESHPGPVHSDGTLVGRGAPEIDFFEAQITNEVGRVSQSAQWAPFNNGYHWFNTSDNLIIPNPAISQLNTYIGGADQQATSTVTTTDQNCYEVGGTGCFSVYGIEYKAGFDDAYISWISNNQVSWTLKQPGMAADTSVEISGRPIPQEPMYLLMNLGQSENFGKVDIAHIPYPVTMRVDYIRVYQPKDAINYGCDPQDFPTAAYIQQYLPAYMDPNLTTWTNDFGQPFPKNKFLGQC